MKTIMICLLCLMTSIVAFGQDHLQKMVDEIEVTPPKFTGVEQEVTVLQQNELQSIDSYLVKKIEYPEFAAKWHMQGTAVVQFVVTEKGEVTDFEVINSVSDEIDDEVIRVLRTTNGMWIPGSNNGEPVAMEKEVSIAFKLAVFPDVMNSITTDFTAVATKSFQRGNKQLYTQGKPKKALRAYNTAIRYRPNETALLLARGICRYELGDREGARQDWSRLKKLEAFDYSGYLTDNLTNMKGYAELMSMLKEE
ncbi:MAG: TonB family protein [Mangrovibacterium sp.]